MYRCVDVSMHRRIYVSMYRCIYVSMGLSIYVSVYLCIYAHVSLLLFFRPLARGAALGILFLFLPTPPPGAEDGGWGNKRMRNAALDRQPASGSSTSRARVAQHNDRLVVHLRAVFGGHRVDILDDNLLSSGRRGGRARHALRTSPLRAGAPRERQRQ